MKVKQRGFTLVEVMVAITIILIALLPIFGSMYGVLYYHREILDREVALGLMRAVENILDSQKDLYTYKSGDVVSIKDAGSGEYPVILYSDGNTGKYELTVRINNKDFTVRAYAVVNPPICTDVPKDSSCSAKKNVGKLYSVKMVISWSNQGKSEEMIFVRRFYKPGV